MQSNSRFSIRGVALAGMALLLAATAATASAASSTLPKYNPYLAQSYNNQGHWNDAATDSTDIAVPRGAYEVAPGSFDIVPNESASLPHYSDKVGGKEIYWWWSGFSLRKLRIENGKFVEIDRMKIPLTLPDYKEATSEERMEQAAAVQKFLQAKDEQGLLDYMKAQPNRMLTAVEDQVRTGAIYSLLTRDDTFVGASGRRLFTIAQSDPKDPESRLLAPKEKVLPEELFDNEKAKRGTRYPVDAMFGVGMTYNGYLLINTVGGKIITLDRKTLDVVDVYTVKGSDELFLNGFATGQEAGGGAVYVASNTTMYRFVVDAKGKIHDDEKSGAWHEPYERGAKFTSIKIADGTGATPTLMGFGPKDDKLVVFTDGANKMRLVAMWRDTIPAGWKQKPGTLSRRIADQREVDLGPEIDTVQSEQSVAVHGDYAFVINNIPTKQAPHLSNQSYFASMINGATRPSPRGAAMMKWDSAKHEWKTQWARTDVGSVSIVPMISGGSRMAIIDGYFADRMNDRHLIGMDLDTGKTVLRIRTGTDPRFNGMFAPIKCDPEGNILFGMAFGLVRMDTSKMKRLDD
ncbi:hypothetical protein SAMN05444747_12629 [Variovorax sp. OV329]|nr:hypothetical protein SAMN05444747_12629 [Variovorax sp. OV329]